MSIVKHLMPLIAISSQLNIVRSSRFSCLQVRVDNNKAYTDAPMAEISVVVLFLW